MTAAGRSSWFANNPDKAWVEKLFLCYSPIWMVLMALMMLTGWAGTWGNEALLMHAFVVMLPILVVPWLIHKRYSDIPWQHSYFLKANVYLGIFGFWGNYAGSEYFFDLLGMVYQFQHATSSLDSALLGSGQQPVPVIMYLYTHAFFMTYHVTANIVLRRLNSFIQPLAVPLYSLMFMLFVFLIGYSWAWIETKAMANPLMADLFYYEKMDLMLKYGSVIYASYFIASFPIYYFIDEDAERPWSWWQVISGALAASTLTFFMLDTAVHIIETL